MKQTDRAMREVSHGRRLSRGDAERTWGWNTPAGFHRASRRGRLIMEMSGMCPEKTILEIGCGTGLFTEMFATSGAHIVALDISEDLLRRAKARDIPEQQVRFLAMSFEDESLQGHFDAVIGSFILHHLNIRPALKRIQSLLKPRAPMVFAEPNMLNPQIMIQKNIPWIKQKLGDSPDEGAFTIWSFHRMLSEAGFCSISIRPFDWLHPLTPPMLIPIISHLGNLLERVPLIRHFAGSLLISAVCQPANINSLASERSTGRI